MPRVVLCHWGAAGGGGRPVSDVRGGGGGGGKMSRPCHPLAVPRAGAVPPRGGSRVALRGRAGLRGGGAGCRAGPGLRAAAAVPPHRAGRRWVVPPGRLFGPSWTALLHRSSALQPCGSLWLPRCRVAGGAVRAGFLLLPR